MNFEVTILGSGSAMPTGRRNPASQFIQCCNRTVLIDCGEGTQVQIRRAGVKLQKIDHILISHLHGDHFFGLVGLLSTMHLLGRDTGLTIYGPQGLKQIVLMQLEIGGAKLDFDLKFIELDGKTPGIIYEDKMIEIHTFPLKHRILTNGYKISEKPKERNIIGEALKEQGISLQAVPFFRRGENYIDEDGIEHDVDDYTYAPKPSKSYAYCSDTKYTESILPYIENVDVLYHEATFTDQHAGRAVSTMHSTAKQAATIALKAHAKRLLMGHLSARYENGEEHEQEARAIFPESKVVEDFDQYFI